MNAVILVNTLFILVAVFFLQVRSRRSVRVFNGIIQSDAFEVITRYASVCATDTEKMFS